MRLFKHLRPVRIGESMWHEGIVNGQALIKLAKNHGCYKCVCLCRKWMSESGSTG